MDVKGEVKLCENSEKKLGGGGGWGGMSGWGGQGGCERRSEVFMKIQQNKKILFFFFGGGVGWGEGGSDQGLGWGRGGSKVWGRWVMWGMGVVINQE